MNKFFHIMLLGSLLPLSNSWAMQALDDQTLATTTGQDGVSIGINLPNSAVAYSEFAIIDTNGISGSATHTSAASLVFAPKTYLTTPGIRFLNADTGSTLAVQPILIDIDTDGGGGASAPLLNAQISLPSDLKRITIDPMSLYLATDTTSIFSASRTSGVTGTTRAGVTEVLRIGTNGLDIIFNAGNTVKLNLQLASEDQGHFFVFTGGSISQIKNDPANPIELLSKNTSGTSSLKLNISLSANNTTTGFQLSGFYGDLTTANGFTFGKVGATDKFDAVIGDVVAGASGTSAAGVFGGLNNGSMGSLGVVGATVTNFKLNVKGL